MRARSLSHLSDGALVRELKSLVGREREATASVVAHMAEVDARRLYAPAGYPSMHAWCVAELHLSEDAAYKRIQAARVARKIPAILDALAAGRLHLSGVCLLAPYLTPGNAEALLAGATHRSKRQIEQFLAERFPRTESLPIVQVIRPPVQDRQLAPGQVQIETTGRTASGTEAARAVTAASVATLHESQLAPGQVQDETVTCSPATPGSSGSAVAAYQHAPDGRAAGTFLKIAPIAPGRFDFHFCVGRDLHELMRHVEALLSHRIPSGDPLEVLERVYREAAEKYEKERFARTSRPQASPRPTRSTRHVPAHVKRTVWKRDGGRCTFVSASGKRCTSRSFLEFDHVLPFAKGGGASIVNLRLRCRTHNQFEAERAFGAGFMHEKRERGRRASRHVRTGEGVHLTRKQDRPRNCIKGFA